MPLFLWYPLTAALILVGFYLVDLGSLLGAVAAFITATYVGFAGAIKHEAP